MKELIHNQKDSSICIYEHDAELLKGSFFKLKPEVGDIIMSHNKREPNFLRMFEVLNIVENKDSNISDKSVFNPKNAYFILSIKEVLKQGKFADIDNCINRLYS